MFRFVFLLLGRVFSSSTGAPERFPSSPSQEPREGRTCVPAAGAPKRLRPVVEDPPPTMIWRPLFVHQGLGREVALSTPRHAAMVLGKKTGRSPCRSSDVVLTALLWDEEQQVLSAGLPAVALEAAAGNWAHSSLAAVGPLAPRFVETGAGIPSAPGRPKRQVQAVALLLRRRVRGAASLSSTSRLPGQQIVSVRPCSNLRGSAAP